MDTKRIWRNPLSFFLRTLLKHTNLQSVMNKNYRFKTHCNITVGLPCPVVERVCLSKGQQWVYTTLENEILFCQYGSLCLSTDNSIDTGAMIILPPGCTFSARARTSVSLFLLRIRKNFKFSSPILKESEFRIKSIHFQPIIIPENIQLLFTLIIDEYDEGLLTNTFLETKTFELFVLLRAHYPKEVLMPVFRPFLPHGSYRC